MPNLPTKTTDLAAFFLYAVCAKCGRSVRIYPGNLPRLPLVELLAKLSCRERCKGRAGYLELTMPGHGIPGSPDQYSPTWRMDSAGSWLERETANPFEAPN